MFTIPKVRADSSSEYHSLSRLTQDPRWNMDICKQSSQAEMLVWRLDDASRAHALSDLRRAQPLSTCDSRHSSMPRIAPIGTVPNYNTRLPVIDDEFKRMVVIAMYHRDLESIRLADLVEKLNLKVEALTIESVKLRNDLNEERRKREEMMEVLVLKEKLEKEEKAEKVIEMRETIVRIVNEELEAFKADQAANDALKKLESAVNKASLKMAEDVGDVDELEAHVDELGDETDDTRDESMHQSQSPSSGDSSPLTTTTTTVPRSTRPCYNYRTIARERSAPPTKRDQCGSCGGRGHNATNCFPSKRCYNCNMYGHRAFECKSLDTRRCYHCHKVGHVAKDCHFKDWETSTAAHITQ